MKYRFKILFALIAFLALLWCYARGPKYLFLIMLILMISAVYTVGLVHLWNNAGLGHGIPVWRAACFLGAMAILVFTLIGPLDALAERAFSMHMIQHMLLMKVVAPLVLLGEFSSVLLWAVGRDTAHQLSRTWKHSRQLQVLSKAFTNPWAAWILFASCLWFWHIPVFYQAALENELLHDLEHFMFLGTSLLFWWYLLQNGRNPKVRYGTSLLYLFTTLLHESALGALLTFSSRNWYAFYTSSHGWALPALADQQLAGVIMWLPGGILFMSLIIWYFAAWLQAIEKRMPAPQAEFAQIGEQNE